MRKYLWLLLLLPLLANAAEENLRPFQPAGPVHQVSVSNVASTPVQVVPSSSGWNGCVQYKVENLGTTDFYVGFGSTSAAATTNVGDVPAPGDTGVAQLVRAGTSHVITNIPNAYVAAKTASGTSTMNIGCGVGSVTGVATGSGTVTIGAGSEVVITDGTDDADVTAAGEVEVLETNSAAIAASASVMDDWDLSDTAKITVHDITLDDWETVAASQTDQACGATGAVGDILVGLLVVPATTSPGAVQFEDGAGSAVTAFAGGASSVSNLVPFFVPLGIKSTSGAWEITTGTNVSVICVGKFT